MHCAPYALWVKGRKNDPAGTSETGPAAEGKCTTPVIQ